MPVSVILLEAVLPTFKTDCKSCNPPPPPEIKSLTKNVTVLLLSLTSVPISKSDAEGTMVGYTVVLNILAI